MSSTMGSRYDDENQSGNVKTTTAARSPLVKKIFGYYYRCRVPAFASRTTAEIKQNGVYVSGIKSIDEAEKNAWDLRDMTIAKMMELYVRGVSFTIVDPRDTKDIYDTVRQHLRNWLEILHTGINISNAPLEDLLQMDKFTASLYPNSKYVFSKDAIDNTIGSHLQSSQRITLHNFFATADKKGKITPVDPSQKERPVEELPEHESMAAQLRDSFGTMRKW